MGRYQNIRNLGKDSVILTSDMWIFVNLCKLQANVFHSLQFGILLLVLFYLSGLFFLLKSSKVILQDEFGIESSALPDSF